MLVEMKAKRTSAYAELTVQGGGEQQEYRATMSKDGTRCIHNLLFISIFVSTIFCLEGDMSHAIYVHGGLA